MKKIIKNKIFIITVSILFAGVLAFVIAPNYSRSLDEKIKIVVAKNDIKEGDILNDKNLEIIKISKTVFNDSHYQNIEEIKGQYAKIVIQRGDFITNKKISKINKLGHELDTLINGEGYISFTVSELSHSLSEQIRKGDLVSIINVDDESGEGIINPLLRYVEIVELRNGGSTVFSPKEREKNNEEEDEQLVTVTVKVDAEQAKIIAENEAGGLIHLFLVCRNNNEMKEELLNEQMKILESLEKGELEDEKAIDDTRE